MSQRRKMHRQNERKDVLQNDLTQRDIKYVIKREEIHKQRKINL